MMNISIRNSIINNFKDSTIDDIEKSINDGINDKDELTLPGLGVFFEILWQNSDSELKNTIIKTIKNNLSKKS